MPLTEDEKMVMNFKSDIDRLEKQKSQLQSMVDSMGKEIDKLYLKRQEISKSIEGDRAGLDTDRKKLGEERGKLEAIKKDIETREFQLRSAHEKLAYEKDLFHSERKVYQVRTIDLENRRLELSAKADEAKKREAEIEKESENLYARQKQLDQENKRVSELKEDLEIQLNSARSSEINYQAMMEELEKTKHELLNNQQNHKSFLDSEKTKLQKEYEDKIKSISDEHESQKGRLKNRELAIVRKEKELDNLKLEYTKKLEDHELQLGRIKGEK